MHETFRAILAGMSLSLAASLAAGEGNATLVAAAAAPHGHDDAAGAHTLSEPRRVAFRLADGARVRGELTSWNRSGFDGSFGRRFWHELNRDDAWRVIRSVMNPKSAADWIDVGSAFLLLTDQSDRAEYAFRRALELEADCGERIEQARADIEAEARRIAEEEARRHAGRLGTTTPEARDWPADPWPALLPRERETARISVMNDAETILEHAGIEADPIESDFFLLYTDIDRRQGAQWAVNLDRHYRTLLEIFGLDQNDNIFWGKAAVFVFKEQDRFRLLEAGAFEQLVTTELTAMTHFSGPKVYINAWRRDDEVMFRAALAHEVVHAFMHRHGSPRRLPAWANEGLAEYLAQRVISESHIHSGLRPLALRLVRSDSSVIDVLNMTYADETFPGRRNEGYAIGHLLIEFLLKKSDDYEFARWVAAIKTGLDWREAMLTYFNGTPEELAEAFRAFYRVND